MTDTKKCGTFLVKISRLADGKCIVLSERPSDALVSKFLDLLEFTMNGGTSKLCLYWEHAHRVSDTSTSVECLIENCDYDLCTVKFAVCWLRYDTLTIPRRPLKRPVREVRQFVDWRPEWPAVRDLVSSLEGAGHEFV